jgi:hypothetical protein
MALEVRQRVVGQGVVESPLLVEVVAIAIEEISSFLHLAKRLHAVLADLECDRGTDVVNALFDDLAHAPQQVAAIGRRSASPARKSGFGCGHCLSNVLPAGDRETPQDGVRIDGADIVPQGIAADVFAVDVVGVVPPEFLASLLERSLESLVQLRWRVEHGRVGEFERHEK